MRRIKARPSISPILSHEITYNALDSRIQRKRGDFYSKFFRKYTIELSLDKSQGSTPTLLRKVKRFVLRRYHDIKCLSLEMTAFLWNSGLILCS